MCQCFIFFQIVDIYTRYMSCLDRYYPKSTEITRVHCSYTNTLTMRLTGTCSSFHYRCNGISPCVSGIWLQYKTMIADQDEIWHWRLITRGYRYPYWRLHIVHVLCGTNEQYVTFCNPWVSNKSRLEDMNKLRPF